MLGLRSSCLIVISLKVMLPETAVMLPEMLSSYVAQNFLMLKNILTSCYNCMQHILVHVLSHQGYKEQKILHTYHTYFIFNL